MPHPPSGHGTAWLALPGSLLLLLCLLTACTAAEQPADQPTNLAATVVAVPPATTPEPTGIPTQGPGTPTSVSTGTPHPTTAVEATRAAYDTRTARLYSDVRTK